MRFPNPTTQVEDFSGRDPPVEIVEFGIVVRQSSDRIENGELDALGAFGDPLMGPPVVAAAPATGQPTPQVAVGTPSGSAAAIPSLTMQS